MCQWLFGPLRCLQIGDGVPVLFFALAKIKKIANISNDIQCCKLSIKPLKHQKIVKMSACEHQAMKC